MLAELVRAQLRAGAWRAARGHLAGRGGSPLAPAAADALVVAAGREYFYAASSLDAPEVAQAQACLAVLPHSAAAAAERDAIAAVLRLRDYGVELPPLQFRQVRARSPTPAGPSLTQPPGRPPVCAACMCGLRTARRAPAPARTPRRPWACNMAA